MGSQGSLAKDPRRGRPRPARPAAGPQPLRAKPDSDEDTERPSAAPKYTSLLETVIEGAAVFVYGVEGHVASLLRLVPKSPISGIIFIAILLVLMFIHGHGEPKDQDFCLKCMGMVTVLGVCLMPVCLRYVGSSGRLSEMQEERAQAIQPKPLHYPHQ
jgi:hypothetical protein